MVAMQVNVNLHYCHGSVNSISFFHSEGECCCSETKLVSNCCFDKNYDYKIESEQIISSKGNFVFKYFETIISKHSEFTLPSLLQPFQIIIFDSPPNHFFTKIPIRILHSIFRL